MLFLSDQNAILNYDVMRKWEVGWPIAVGYTFEMKHEKWVTIEL